MLQLDKVVKPLDWGTRSFIWKPCPEALDLYGLANAHPPTCLKSRASTSIFVSLREAARSRDVSKVSSRSSRMHGGPVAGQWTIIAHSGITIYPISRRQLGYVVVS